MKSLLLNSDVVTRDQGGIVQPSTLTVDHTHKKLYVGQNITLNNGLILSIDGELITGSTINCTIVNYDAFSSYRLSLNESASIEIKDGVFPLELLVPGINTLDLYENNVFCNRVELQVTSPSLNGIFTQKANSNVQRSGYAAGSDDQYLIFYGGISGNRLTHGRRYNISTDGWVNIASGPSSRNVPAGCIHEGFFYVAGGYDGSSRLSDFWRYEISRNIWTKRADLPVTQVNQGSMCAQGNFVYLHCANNKYFGRYDNQTNTWTDLSIEGIVNHSGRDRLFSDGETIFYLSTMLHRYSVDENKWYLMSGIPWNTSSTVATVHSDGNIYALDQNAGFFVFESEDNWRRISDCPVSTSSLILLSAGDKLFIHTSDLKLWEIS